MGKHPAKFFRKCGECGKDVAVKHPKKHNTTRPTFCNTQCKKIWLRSKGICYRCERRKCRPEKDNPRHGKLCMTCTAYMRGYYEKEIRNATTSTRA